MRVLLDFAPRGSGLRLVASASLLARLPIGMTGVTLPLYVLSTGLSPLAAACAGAAFGAGQAAGSPMWGRQSDGRPIRQLIGVSEAGFALLVVLMVLVRPSAAGYTAISLALGLFALPFSAAMRAFWLRQDLGPGQESAARFESWLSEAVLLGGRVITSTLLLALSCRTILGGQAALAVAGGLVLTGARRIRTDQPVPTPGARRQTRDLVGFGRQYLTYFLLSASLGTYSFALIVTLSDRSSAWAAGGVAVWGLGSLVGVSMTSAGLSSLSKAFLAMGIAQVALVLTDAAPVDLAAAFVAGLPIALIVTRMFHLLGATAPPHRRGEIFAWASTALFVGNSFGTAAAGVWVDVVSARSTVIPAGLLAAVAALAAVGYGPLKTVSSATA